MEKIRGYPGSRRGRSRDGRRSRCSARPERSRKVIPTWSAWYWNAISPSRRNKLGWSADCRHAQSLPRRLPATFYKWSRRHGFREAQRNVWRKLASTTSRIPELAWYAATSCRFRASARIPTFPNAKPTATIRTDARRWKCQKTCTSTQSTGKSAGRDEAGQVHQATLETSLKTLIPIHVFAMHHGV